MYYNLHDPILIKRNISLEAELFREVRAECIRLHYPLSLVAGSLLRGWLDKQKKEGGDGTKT